MSVVKPYPGYRTDYNLQPTARNLKIVLVLSLVSFRGTQRANFSEIHHTSFSTSLLDCFWIVSELFKGIFG